jgi:hypothetical protein
VTAEIGSLVARLRASMAGFDTCLAGAAMAKEAADTIERLQAAQAEPATVERLMALADYFAAWAVAKDWQPRRDMLKSALQSALAAQGEPVAHVAWNRERAISMITDERITLLQVESRTHEQEQRLQSLNEDINALCRESRS